MKFTFLTKQFYKDYEHCHEIEKKELRPYTQVYTKIGGFIFTIPLRSNINHPNVLWTDKENKHGLDFSKAVIIIDEIKYIDKTRIPHINDAEFNSLRGKEYIVKQNMIKYIEIYKEAKQQLNIPRNEMLCRCSTLQYFEQYIENIKLT